MNKEGSITVFLSLVGLLIFALLGTLVETARFGVCENRASRTLQTSAEGLLTEYSRPLQKQYDLFFLEQRGTPYETVISRYAGTSMETSKGKMDLLMGTFREISVTEKFCAGDNGGEAIQNQITAYMEKTLTKKALEKYKKKSEIMQTSEKEAEKMDELVREQEEIAKLYQTLSTLIKLVDGISVSKGKISCEDNFVKSFCCKKEPEGIDYGITESAVWKEMKKKLDDSTFYWKNCFSKTFLEKLNKVIKVTEQAVKEGEKLKREYEFIEVKTDKKSENLANESIKDIINNLSVLDGNLFVLNETKNLLSEYQKNPGNEKEKKDVMKTKLKKIWKDYNTSRMVFDYTGVTEKGGAFDPSEELSKAWNGGILSLVMTKEEFGKLSKKRVSHSDYYADYYDMVPEKKQDAAKRMDAFVEKGESSFSGILADGAVVSWEKFCFLSYMQEKFGHYKMRKDDAKWKKSLAYAQEYVIAGKNSDKENLEAVLTRLLLLRTPINFAAIYADAGKKAEAYTAAAAIVGFSGMEPLIRLTQTVILIVWSVAESLLDIAGMLNGKKVPVVKNPKNIVTTFAEIFQLQGDAIVSRTKRIKTGAGNSAGYEEYLQLFLAFSEKSVCNYRLMDLMEWDMRKNGYSNFTIGSSVYAIRVKGIASFPSRIFRMSPLEQLLGRSLKDFQTTCETVVSY